MEIYITVEEIEGAEEKAMKIKTLLDELLDAKDLRYTYNTQAAFLKLISYQHIPIRNGVKSMEWDNGSIYINNYEDAVKLLSNKPII